MRAKYAALHQEWRVMDVRSLELADAEVDVAVDKGTLDAMIHGSLWDPPEDVCENVGRYVDEVARVLRPGGLWLHITYRQPHFMRRHLEREGVWTAEVEVVGAGWGGRLSILGGL
jgi:hypothetical protein